MNIYYLSNISDDYFSNPAPDAPLNEDNKAAEPKMVYKPLHFSRREKKATLVKA